LLKAFVSLLKVVTPYYNELKLSLLKAFVSLLKVVTPYYNELKLINCSNVFFSWTLFYFIENLL